MLFTYKSDSAIRQLHSSAWHSSSNTSEVDNLMSCVKIVRTLPTGSLGHSSTKDSVSETEDQSKGTRRPEGGFGMVVRPIGKHNKINREYVKDPLTHEGRSQVCIK